MCVCVCVCVCARAGARVRGCARVRAGSSVRTCEREHVFNCCSGILEEDLDNEIKKNENKMKKKNSEANLNVGMSNRT